MNIVLNCDCMEFMRGQEECFTLQGRKWDFKDVLAIVDPPYGKKIVKKTNKKDGVNKKDGYIRRSRNWKEKEWDNKPPDKLYFDTLFSRCRKYIIWGGNYFTDKIKPHNGWLIWDKCRGMGNEMAVTNIINNMKIFRYMWNGEMYQGKSITEGHIMQGNIKKREKIIHPTQKPVNLYRWLLKNYATPGQLIFDSHVGSGSLRIACHDMGFDFVGCELDYDYWQAQEERYENHIANQELISPQEIQDAIWEQGVIKNGGVTYE